MLDCIVTQSSALAKLWLENRTKIQFTSILFEQVWDVIVWFC